LPLARQLPGEVPKNQNPCHSDRMALGLRQNLIFSKAFIKNFLDSLSSIRGGRLGRAYAELMYLSLPSHIAVWNRLAAFSTGASL